jgi:hypothetical protein
VCIDVYDKLFNIYASKEELAEKLRNVITLSNFTVMPLFSEVWKTVHPAIDVVDGVAYVGVNLCHVRLRMIKAKWKFESFIF